MIPWRRRRAETAVETLADALSAPPTLLAAWWLSMVRRIGVRRLPITRRVLRRVGIFPIRDHFGEPLFNPARLRRALTEERHLPGIDLDVPGQLRLLERFECNAELEAIPDTGGGEGEFCYDNPAFGPGDAEFLYNVLRLFKPRRYVEVGSGHSTLLAHRALARNAAEDPGARCEILCIEPYPKPWLRTVPARLVEQPVEEVDPDTFRTLVANDVLFIDSSHIIRPQGDVVVQVLSVLPALAPGVLVHVHDIFTPRDYPEPWLVDEVRLWNEQYLLEAFLSCNRQFRVLGAVNHLKHRYFDALAAKSPALARYPEREPGSFWMVRVREEGEES